MSTDPHKTAPLTAEEEDLIREFLAWLDQNTLETFGYSLMGADAELLQGFARWQAAQGPRCLECHAPAVWRRSTQFSGDHDYCDRHAHEERNFGKEMEGYFVWEALR